MSRIMLALSLLCVANPVCAQLTRNCGDTQEAAMQLSKILLYFTEGGPHAGIRGTRWQTLPNNVAHSVVSDVRKCREIVRKVNDRIATLFPVGHVFRSAPMWHKIFEIGPYYVVVFTNLRDSPDVVPAGWAPMWIFDKTTLAFVSAQGV
jgi:hypothetical protein